MTHQSASATSHDPPVPESQTQPVAERDTLNDTPELRFLRDEIEALLGATSVRGAMHDARIDYVDPSDEEELETSIHERDTEPNIDAQLVREIARTVGK